MRSEPLHINWEIERVYRLPDTDSPFELITPIIIGQGDAPNWLAVNRQYVIEHKKNGTVLHSWGEKHNLDCESIGNCWELPVYDESLHKLEQWTLLVDGTRFYIKVPKISVSKNISNIFKFKYKEKNTFYFEVIPDYSCELIRQSIAPNGNFKEERSVINGKKTKTVKVKLKPKDWPYDAILLSISGLEEKFILKGEII